MRVASVAVTLRNQGDRTVLARSSYWAAGRNSGFGNGSSVKAARDVDRGTLEAKLQSAYFEQVGLKDASRRFSGR